MIILFKKKDLYIYFYFIIYDFYIKLSKLLNIFKFY